MPRRESYRTDDEDDDDRRRAGATGGGVPAWVWVAGGGGVLAVLLCAGGGLALFTGRQAAVRQEVMRVEADRERVVANHDHDEGPDPGAPDGAELPEISLERIANAYRTDPDAADARYAGKRVRVRFVVTGSGDGWVGATVGLRPDQPPGPATNVIFRLPGATVAEGARVVVEGRCAGHDPGPGATGELTFTDCRLIRR